MQRDHYDMKTAQYRWDITGKIKRWPAFKMRVNTEAMRPSSQLVHRIARGNPNTLSPAASYRCACERHIEFELQKRGARGSRS
jgi:hypothetical protein